MKKTGQVILPLHGGHAPSWLTNRMKKLSDALVQLIFVEQGRTAFLRRLADPFWFQAFGCVLGFDWHSSGLTTVVTGILKDVLRFDRHGVEVAGGKGKASRNTQREIVQLGDQLNLSSRKIEALQYASRMCAKVDTAAIQAGYPLYHHTFFVTERGEWCVVQQGLNTQDRTARRYHWLSEHVESFVVEPHDAIVGEAVKPHVFNMTANEAAENRRTCVDLVKDDPHNLVSSIKRLSTFQHSLDHWVEPSTIAPSYQAYAMPRNLDWGLFTQLYDVQPRNYEELLAVKGVGPATVRALALVAELVYGKPVSWRDPVKYSFAYGGKDGVPFPVDRRRMDQSIEFLRQAVDSAGLPSSEKTGALRRLGRLADQWGC